MLGDVYAPARSLFKKPRVSKGGAKFAAQSVLRTFLVTLIAMLFTASEPLATESHRSQTLGKQGLASTSLLSSRNSMLWFSEAS